MGNIDGPIAISEPALEFEDLARLRDQSRVISEQANVALSNFRDRTSGGYFHLINEDTKEEPNKPDDPSRASSATVVSFLVRSGRWTAPDNRGTPRAAAQRLINRFVQPGDWLSAELPPDNAFTIGFLLELIATLVDAGGRLSRDQKAICRTKLNKLVGALSSKRGGLGRVSIRDEVANSYLTDLATRVLEDWSARKLVGEGSLIADDLRAAIRDAAINSVNGQMAFLTAERPGGELLRADVFELGYASLVAAHFAGDRLTPEHRSLLREALGAFFSAQRSDGSWPRSNRLFTYPRYGDAYCFDFEFLARLLRAFSGVGPDANQKSLLPYLSQFQAAVTRLIREAKALPDGAFGWSSGHHRAFVFPESWSTACCFDVCDQVDRVVTDAITATIQEYLGSPRYGPEPIANAIPFNKLLDSRIHIDPSADPTLRAILLDRLLKPVTRQKQKLAQGKQLEAGTAMSAIFYGPPGTSKTTYAERIGSYLGWPLLTVDPSHLLRSGFDNIHLEISRLFKMLEKAERVVVFFDEIDGLVRDRSAVSVGEVSRFLTTSMLPRILNLRASRRLIFLVATNHIETFDPAIARPGRFDLVLPVLPPSVEQKFAEWPAIEKVMSAFGLATSVPHREQLERLTFDETAAVEPILVASSDPAAFSNALQAAWTNGVLRQPVTRGEEETWEELMRSQETRIRFRS
jgi:hypothetical protein